MNYWEFYDMKMRVRRGYPKRIAQYLNRFLPPGSQCPVEEIDDLTEQTETIEVVVGEKYSVAENDQNKDGTNNCCYTYINCFLMMFCYCWYNLINHCLISQL